ncbi:MAG: alpha/beta hydrolase family protein [Mycobacterium leprae]
MQSPPLLMLHGTADKTLPVKGVQRFLAKAQPLYATHPDHLVLTEYPRLNHWTTTTMVAATRDWLERYL